MGDGGSTALLAGASPPVPSVPTLAPSRLFGMLVVNFMSQGTGYAKSHRAPKITGSIAISALTV